MAGRRLELMVRNGPFAGRRFSVTAGGVRLGRSSANDIPIPDESLSRNHCLFEVSGETGIKVTDLASANGTMVNGQPLGDQSVELKAGDVIEAGDTVLMVVGEGEDPKSEGVDLGLGGGSADADFAGGTDASSARLRPFLWLVALLVVVGAIALALLLPVSPSTEQGETKELAEEKPVLRELYYEKVEANTEGIFRFALSVSADTRLSVELDDTKGDRHPVLPSKRLEASSVLALEEMLADEAIRRLDTEYVGTAADDISHSSLMLEVRFSTFTQTVSVLNVQEPEAFRMLRNRLETFAQNELGINAIQYSTARLIELAQEAVAAGEIKWEDRDAQHGNVADAVQSFREALFYLQTVEPKPPCAQVARRGLDLATAELDRRAKEQRFLADKALNLGRWEEAERELQVLLEMVPDRKDERNREATTKLLDVEKRLKGAK